MLPAIAVLAARSGGGPAHNLQPRANGTQDGPILGREGLGELPAEVRRRQRHARIFGAKETESRAPAARPRADQDVLFLGHRAVNVHRLAASRQTKPSL